MSGSSAPDYQPGWNSDGYQGTHQSYGHHYDHSYHGEEEYFGDYGQEYPVNLSGKIHCHNPNVRSNSFPQTADPSTARHRYTCGASTVTFGDFDYYDPENCSGSDVGGGSS